MDEERPAFRAATRRSPKTDVDDELAFHLEMRVRELIDQGWPPEAARAEAIRRFGDLDDARKYMRKADDRRETHTMRKDLVAELQQDLAFAVRTLRKAPVFTSVAVITLALGIAATTTIFSVVRGILLRPLPYRDPSALVAVRSLYNGIPSTSSAANIADFADQNSSFTSIASLVDESTVLTGAGEPVQLNAQGVSADFFTVLGADAIKGRSAFTAEEGAWHGPHAALINESLWRSRFGASDSTVGSMITLDGERYEVVGVIGRDVAWPAEAQIWTPFRIDPASLSKSRGAQYIRMLARLKPGVTLERANTDMHAIAARLATQYANNNTGLNADVIGLHESLAGDLRQPLFMLLGGVGFVLLIACANVANLQLVRGVAREGELAVRRALGAGRGRLVRQLVTESVLLAVTGCAVGILLARAGTYLIVRAAPSSIPRLDAVQMDWMVLTFAAVVAVFAGVVFGLVPARQLLRPDLAGTLREGGKGAAHRVATQRTRRALVVVEVALSVALLAGAGLLVRSFQRLMNVDPGFHSAHAMSFSLSLPAATYKAHESHTAFLDQFLSRVRAVPGVTNAGAAFGLPLTSFSFSLTIEVTGRPAVDPAHEMSAQIRIASADYLPTMGVPIIRGRGFTEADRAGAARVVLITQAFADRIFPNEDPIGKHVTFPWYRGKDQLGGDIIGIVGEVKQQSLALAPRPQVWAPFAQWPVESFTIVMRTQGDPHSVMGAARSIVHDLDRNLAVTQERTLDQVVATSVSRPRFYMLLLTVFSAVALVLTAVGIYGVVAYLVGQREREIGIRVALGASHANVAGIVMREGITMVGAGIVVGLAGALALTQLMTKFLFKTTPGDVPTYIAVTVILGLVALTASLVPALRAARVDPLLAMRAE